MQLPILRNRITDYPDMIELFTMNLKHEIIQANNFFPPYPSAYLSTGQNQILFRYDSIPLVAKRAGH